MTDSKPCLGRYCECRYHLTPDIPAWAIEGYMPSLWAMEVLHAIWLENRSADEITDDERTVLLGELGRLVDNAKQALEAAP